MSATPGQAGAAILNHPGIANQLATENPGLTGRYLRNLYNTSGPNAQADMRGIARYAMNNGMPQGYTGVSPMPRYGDQLNRLRKNGGRLTASDRQALPKKDFALPGKGEGPKGAGSGSYPIPDASHARNALSRASANASPAQQATIRRKVHAKFPGIGQKD